MHLKLYGWGIHTNIKLKAYKCYYSYYLLFLSALSNTQWSTLVTGRYMITMMVLLCYVDLSGMSLECIVRNCINEQFTIRRTRVYQLC